MAVVADLPDGLGAAVKGATVLQLRAPDLAAAALAALARELMTSQPLPLLVSARLDVALAVGTAGVHLPEHDLPVAAARRLAGAILVGRSVHSSEAARESAAEGADYLLFGPVFETPSHPGRIPAGLAALAQVVAAVDIPVLAIGGVNAERAPDCLAVGAAGYAAISAFAETP